MTTLDWSLIVLFFAAALGVGLVVARRAGSNASEFFLSGRNMPWWLLGVSMVATTFSTDTPNLVTDIVRKNGVSGNWVWWAFVLTGMLTVFVYARLWRRSEVLTDVEFYEIRYSGRMASFLRGFRAIYLGVFFNIMIMAAVSLAAIKIGGVVLGLSPLQSVFWAMLVTVCFSTLGGLRGVLITDFMLFVVAMAGAVAVAYFAVQHPDIGSLKALFSHELVRGKLDLFPQLVPAADGGYTPESINLLVSVLIIPLAVQWWSVWYPGSEPGGGGYLAQRMLAAKDERHATAAVLFFNCAHYALRPWPWIIVALASLVVYPTVQDIQSAFPGVPGEILNDDLAYPAMLKFLPPGWFGLVLASLVAAYMSTISTHLNWGSSYVVNDVYKRFWRPQAGDRELVLVGRLSTVLMMVAAGAFALQLRNALEAFNILLQIGAGTGLIFILRWFWWRINAAAELAAMVISFVVALAFFANRNVLAEPLVVLETWQELVLGVGITTAGWLATAFLTRPTDSGVLRRFVQRINPGGPGWGPVLDDLRRQGEPGLSADPVNLPRGMLGMALGSLGVYLAIFATGYWLYGRVALASVLTVLAALAAFGIAKLLFSSAAKSKRKTIPQ